MSQNFEKIKCNHKVAKKDFIKQSRTSKHLRVEVRSSKRGFEIHDSDLNERGNY